jgi:hypothetical protein
MARIITSSGGGDGHQDTAPLLKNGRQYDAVLVEIKDTEKRKYQSDEFEPAVRLVWNLSFKGDEVGTISKKYKPSIHEKAALHAVIKAMTGQAPKSGFDLDSLIGRKCIIVADIWTTTDGEDRNGVGAILPADEDDDQTPPPPANAKGERKAAGF